MAYIQLTKKRKTIIDDEDIEKCSEYHWYVYRLGKALTEYVIGYKYHLPLVRLHRFLLGMDKSDKRIVHHINGNTLDNRKENLQIMSASKHNKLPWRINHDRPKRNTTRISTNYPA